MFDNVSYNVDGSIHAELDGDQLTIPDENSNRYRQMLIEWEKTPGNSIAPYVPPAVPDDYIIGKTTPWRRMTDDEAAQVEAAMATAPARQRMIYNAASDLRTTDEFWVVLQSMLTIMFGSARANELLAREED